MLDVIREIVILSISLLVPAVDTEPQTGPEVGDAPGPVPQAVQEQRDHAAALEEAGILEKVERRYEEALKAYRELIAKKSAASFHERAALGAGRCLMKLGRYDEAVRHLQGVLQESLSPETAAVAEELLASVRRLGTTGRHDSAPSVDNMVWQLLDMACGDKEVVHKKEVWDKIIRMGPLAVPVLKEAALDRDYIRSVTAFTILSQIEDPSIMPFMQASVTSPDLALRKRCLDAFTSQVSLPLDWYYASVMIRFLRDDERVLRLQALNSRLVVLAYIQSTDSERDELFRLLREHCESDDDELRRRALLNAAGLLTHIIDNNRNEPRLQDIVAIVESIFTRHPPSSLTSEKVTADELLKAIGMAFRLGKKGMHLQLSEKAAHYWTYPYSNVQIIAVDAACNLPLPDLMKIATDMFDCETGYVLNRFAEVYPFDKFLEFPAELRHRFLDGWGRLGYGTGRDLYKLSAKKWPPQDWAILLRAILKNENSLFQSTHLSGLKSCPAPNDPNCFEAMSEYVVRPGKHKYYDGLGLVAELVNDGSLDPGLDGALKLIGLTVNAIAASEDSSRAKPGKVYFSKGIFHSIKACIDKCGPEMVGDWLLAQDSPGLLDDLAWQAILINELNKDRSFAQELWPRLSSKAKEKYFWTIYHAIKEVMGTSKQEWLIPVLKEWEFNPEWNEDTVTLLMQVLDSLENPELAGLSYETVRHFIEQPELHSVTNWFVAGNLTEKMIHHSDAFIDLVPPLFQIHSGLTSSPRKRLIQKILAVCLKNPRKVLVWLAADYPPDFKRAVIEVIFDTMKGVPGLSNSLNLSDFFQQNWSRLDRETQVDCLVRIADYIHRTRARLIKLSGEGRSRKAHKDPRIFLTGFLVFLLQSDAPPVDKHLAYALIVSAGLNEGVDAVIAYLGSLEPGAGDGPLAAGEPGDRAIIDKTADNMPDWRSRWEPNFSSHDTTNRLGLAILAMPVHHPNLAQWAAQNVTVRSDDDLKAVIAAGRIFLTSGAKPRLLVEALDYLLLDWHKKVQALDPDADRTAVPLPDKAVQLLEEAMTFNPQWGDSFNNNFEAAFRFIASNEIHEMLPRVREEALHNPEPGWREEAIKCLDRFLDSENIPTFLECIKDKNEFVRIQAGTALQNLKNYEDRIKTYQAMAAGEDDAPVEPAVALVEQLRSDDAEVRLYAIKALGKLADPNTLPVLVKMMAEGTPEEREAAKAAVDAITGADE